MPHSQTSCESSVYNVDLDLYFILILNHHNIGLEKVIFKLLVLMLEQILLSDMQCILPIFEGPWKQNDATS